MIPKAPVLFARNPLVEREVGELIKLMKSASAGDYVAITCPNKRMATNLRVRFYRLMEKFHAEEEAYKLGISFQIVGRVLRINYKKPWTTQVKENPNATNSQGPIPLSLGQHDSSGVRRLPDEGVLQLHEAPGERDPEH